MSSIVIPDDKAGTIYTTPKTFFRIQEYVDACEYEIHGYGHVSLDDGDLVLSELFPIPKQIVSAAEVETQESAMVEMIKSPFSKRLNFQWHSHVNMGAFWSTTDEQCISQLGKTINNFVSMVMNKKGDYKIRLDIFRPFRITIPLVLRMQYPTLSASEIKKIKEEVKEKTIKKSYKQLSSDDDIVELGESRPFVTVVNSRPSFQGSKGFGYTETGIMFTYEGSVYEEINVSMSLQGWCRVDGALTRVQDINWLTTKFSSERRRLIENGGEANQQSLFPSEGH